MPLIQHQHLVDWSQREGQSIFGELIRRLVYATAFKFNPVANFLSGPTNNESGWDGIVEFQSNTAGQPRHQSLWEISTREDFETKFDEDYKSSAIRALPENWVASKVIYVAATLRKKISPNKKKKLKESLIAKYGCRWGWVVILDVDDFVLWLEKVPSVTSWAAAELKLGNERFGKSLEHVWRNWARESRPSLTESLLTAGRDLSSLRSALQFKTREWASIQVDSVSEAIGLVYCAIHSFPERDAHALLSNALVVSDANSASDLAQQIVPPESAPLTILMPHAASKSELLIQAGHRVVHVYGRGGQRSSVLTFERASVGDFQNALNSTMKIDQRDAELQARACGCSVSVWHIRNLLDGNRHFNALPQWAEKAHANTVVPAIFLGGWNETSKPDRQLIESLSKTDASKYFGDIQPFGICDDPLFEVIGTDRMLIAPTAAFAFIAPHITSAHLESLRLVCIGIFSSITPEVSARWEGVPGGMRVRKPSEEYSEWILDGLAETLLRVAVLDDDLVRTGALSSYGSGQNYVDQLVRSLPGLSQDPRVMASLNQKLPLIAEAATSPFIEALESLLQGDSARLSIWLGDEEGIFGRSFHTGLLWALEMLAWSPEHLGKAANLLARLALVDPGGQLSNRPLNSLREIFLPWHPQTSASLEIREAVLKNICVDTPVSGWRLLVKLLPSAHQMAQPTCKPVWRDFGQINTETLTRAQVSEAYQRYIRLTIDIAGQDLAKLSDVIHDYSNLPAPHQKQVENALLAAGENGSDDENRDRIWRALHKLIVRHRGFADAQWAMPPMKLERLEEIANLFAARDLIDRHRWLFDDQLPETGHPESDHVGWEADVDKKRKFAISEIQQSLGWPGIHRLVQICRYPYLLGSLVADSNQEVVDVLEALDVWRLSGTHAGKVALQSASESIFRRIGASWTNSLLNFARSRRWPPKEIAVSLIDYPDSSSTFELVASLGEDVSAEYWRNRYGYLRISKDDQRTIEIAASQFVAHDRAADLIDMNRPQLQTLGYQSAMHVVDAMVEQLEHGKDFSRASSIDYDLQELFKWLRKQEAASEIEIARREYALLPLFTEVRSEGESLSLHSLMASDPAVYVDVLCDLYKPASGERETAGRSSEEISNRADSAYSLLDSWLAPPGIADDKSVNAEILSQWIDAVRSFAKTRDRAAIGDQQIGKLLFHLPPDPDDKSQPHAVVRALFERLRSTEIETGFRFEAFNSQGVTRRGLYDGGALERKLESSWRQHAKTVGTKWQRAQKVCIAIAEGWQQRAKSEDDEVKKRRTHGAR